MDFVQLDASAWRTSAAILSGGSALIAILAGIEQMSSSARAKNNIEWLQASLQQEQEGPRREALEKKLVQNQARLIARQEVPLWYLSPILVWPLLVILALYSASGEHNSLLGLTFAVIGTIIFGLNLIRTTIRAYCERTRIYYQFYSGKYKFRPAEIDILALMEGGTRKEFVQSGFLIVGTSFGFAALILSVKYGPNPWRIVILLASIFAVLVTCMFVKDYAYTFAGDSTGGISAFQKRINIRKVTNSVLGSEFEEEINGIDTSIQTIEKLRAEVDEAMRGPIRAGLGDMVRELKKNIHLVISDLESLRNKISSSEAESNFTEAREQIALIDKKIEQIKIAVQSIKFSGLE